MRGLFLLFVFVPFLLSAQSNPKSTTVKGYVKKDGEYVPSHKRSVPNSTQKDNWSTKGNVNPSTGKSGTKRAKH